jgi:spermidine/putrescine-binding protein
MQLTRRGFLANASMTAGGAAAFTLFRPSNGRSAGELRMMTWEGYATDDIIRGFVEATGVSVARTYMGSNDEYMAKLAAGGDDYDIVVIVTSFAQQAIKQGFIEPLDLAKLPNFTKLYPEFQKLPFYKSEGKSYGAPTYWGLVPLTVNAEVIPDRNDFGLLFDPQYKGKIAMWEDVSTLAQVARWMGITNIWDMNDEELERVKAKMIEQKPLVRKYWTQAGEAIDLFASGEIVAALSWDYVTQELLKGGYNVRQPEYENAMAWSDSHTIVKGSANADLAHQFIDHMIGAQAQAQIADVNLYRVTNPEAKAQMKPELWEFLKMDSAARQLPVTEFWGAVPRRAKYLEVWNEIKAA